ncbi:glutamate receptor 2.7-like [Macadamia integrifolia]|uniref:glutamate receptor 2.7-like n=1 Tax=Macadamia integrifolia TaxID=60698 RepID=UPI001C4F7F71|nr:glutamate receptor 2.7-like [Macadamia integrifolia]
MISVTRLLFLILFHILILFHEPAETVGDDTRTVNLGAIINTNSRIGKEVKTALEIAIQSFNNYSDHYKLDLQKRDSGGDPLKAKSAAEQLIRKQRVEAILGMETWQEAALVAEAGDRAKIPIFSFATTSVPASLTSKQWPFLVRMTNNEATKMKCVATVVGAYKWRNVIAIYEDDSYGSNSRMFVVLSDALRNVTSQVEYRMAFPPISLLSNPKDEILEELGKLKSKHFARVFIIIQPSVSFASHLFKEAKRIGLMDRESVWITTNAIDSFNSSLNPSMQGVFGIKTYFSESSFSFNDFDSKFREKFRSEYPDEEKFKPGIHAVRAYDAISTLKSAMNNNYSITTSKLLVEKILSSRFSGLSGEIQFEDGEFDNSPVFQFVNVTGNSYNYTMEGLKGGTVEWPGGLRRVPKGWVYPSDLKPMKIGVPGRPVFEEFVKVKRNKNPDLPPVLTGFCIKVFEEAVKILSQTISYEFEDFNGTYDDLIMKVNDTTYDAAVGDITILADRSKYVEFTRPFTPSGLSLIVRVKKESRAWMFLKPFTTEVWVVTGLVLLYTMFVVWFLEHGSNLNFKGTRKVQLANPLWFTFSTLFFCHSSHLAADFSNAILQLLENGDITRWEEEWFNVDAKCSISGSDVNKESLGLDSFGGLFALTGGASTMVFIILFVLRLRKKRKQYQAISGDNIMMSLSNGSRWARVRELLPVLLHQTPSQHHLSEMSHLEYNSTPGYGQAQPMAEIEMEETSTTDLLV